MKIYLLDDDKNVLNILKIIIKERGLGEVCGTALNGNDALEDLHYTKPDIIIVDMLMPEMDGIETAKRIMEMTDHTVPILFVTALCDRQTVTLCRNLDAAGYIVRPYKPVFVKTEIKRILMGRSEIE